MLARRVCVQEAQRGAERERGIRGGLWIFKCSGRLEDGFEMPPGIDS